MSVSLGRNISALKAQRQLARVSEQQRDVFSRLSSGQRINKAADDAAGLAIADALRADSRIATTAIRNANDAISALSIADLSLGELSEVVTRIAELAEQSANGVFTYEQRQALDNEAQALRQEFQRIVETTEFNGIKLLDGSQEVLDFQIGFDGGEDSRLLVNAPSGATRVEGDGTFQALATLSGTAGARGVTVGDFNNDGNTDIIGIGDGAHEVILGDGNGGVLQTISYDPGLGATASRAARAADLNGDGYDDLVFHDLNAGSIAVSLADGSGSFAAAVSYGVGDFDYQQVEIGDVNGDGAIDFAGVSNAGDEIIIYTNNGAGVFVESDRVATTDVAAVGLADVNGDGNADVIGAGDSSGEVNVALSNGDGTFAAPNLIDNSYPTDGTVATGDFNGDGFVDIGITATSVADVVVYHGDGTGGFGAAVESSALSDSGNGRTSVADLNGDGFDDIARATSSGVSIILGNANGTYSEGSFVTGNPVHLALADFSGDGALDIVTHTNGGSPQVAAANSISVSGLADFSLLSAAESRDALDSMSATIASISASRSILGASHSRVATSVNNLSVTRENFLASESRNREADVAEESARLVRYQILQQASAAVLSHANQQPSLAISLLG